MGTRIFWTASDAAKACLYLTGHIGAWELSSFAHALYGFPLHYMARPLDNLRVDTLVNRYRCLSGNRPVFKNESARLLLKILREAGTVGILADQNTMPEEGVFVDFFGTPACTTTGIARVALHTDAAVVPGYAYWDEPIAKVSIAIRARRGIDSNRRYGARRFRQHAEVCEGDRGDYSKTSGAVGVGACAVEDTA